MAEARSRSSLAGGSLYWVFKGLVLARQRILGARAAATAPTASRAAPIRLDPEVVRTVPQPRRPFQGWRYLRPEDAPRDLAPPPPRRRCRRELVAGLAAIGVL